MEFKFNVDLSAVAARLGQTREIIEDRVVNAVRTLSMATHAFLIQKANTELEGYQREAYLGGDNKNIRWVEVTPGLWVVELDPSASWIEDGRPATSMATADWLLKPDKVKTAKDGSTYRSIPFTHASSDRSKTLNSSPGLQGMVRHAMKTQGIHKTKIERNPDGSPKLGVIHKLNIFEPDKEMVSGFHSRERTPEEAALTGLKPHTGIFYGKDAAVIQRQNQKGKVIKEVVTFRTVSSKHSLEGRWMYPEVKAFHGMDAAYRWAETEFEKILQSIDQELRQ